MFFFKEYDNADNDMSTQYKKQKLERFDFYKGLCLRFYILYCEMTFNEIQLFNQMYLYKLISLSKLKVPKQDQYCRECSFRFFIPHSLNASKYHSFRQLYEQICGNVNATQ